MINFYSFYNKTGLDKEEYSILIEQVMDDEYTKELGLIEHIIKKNPRYAYDYAMKILKGGWIEAEPYFKGDSYGYWWNDYCEYFKI